MDAVNGPLVASLNVPNTGDWQNWITVTGSLTPTDNLKHDLYVVFTGTIGQDLFNINWFQFQNLIAGTSDSTSSSDAGSSVPGSSLLGSQDTSDGSDGSDGNDGNNGGDDEDPENSGAIVQFSALLSMLMFALA